MLRAEDHPFGCDTPLDTVRRLSRTALAARLTVAFAAAGLLVGVRSGYIENQAWLFFGGFGLILCVTAGWLRRETGRVKFVGWMVWQRCAAALLMFAILEAGYRIPEILTLSPKGQPDSNSVRVVTYTEAQGDPHAFSAWWDRYSSEWHRHAELIQTFTPGGPVPYVFKPQTSRPFLHGTVSVNSLGLCDREIPLEKGDRFRIVVMGSSHTQCPPIEATDTPWPAKLEQMIRERVATDREIEVLNAGAAGYTLENNLHRLTEAVLPLKPDMIITYFGYNEFERFREDFRLPMTPPKPQPRASNLLGKLDWRFAKWRAEFGSAAEPLDDMAALGPRLTRCRLALAYQEYLRIARERGIPLVVCNFNMAVDDQSPAEVIRFYEQGFPNVKFMIAANRLNTAMLPLIIRPNSGARSIDVQEGLDGDWDGPYVDLVHLSESGKARLAENVLSGILDLLPRSTTLPVTPPARPQLADDPDTKTLRL